MDKGGRFQGRVAVITGSTAGIGLAVARRLLSEGGSVVITSRNQKSVDQTVSTLAAEFKERVSGIACHVGQAEARSKLLAHAFKTHGKIDILVLNAALSPPLPSLMDTSEEAWRKVMDTNVTSNFLLAKQACTGTEKMSSNGSIVLVSSIGGFLPAAPHPAYGISKTALFGLTKALASELAAPGEKAGGIRVNCVAPGMIKTKFSQPIWQQKSVEQMIANRTLMGRLGESHEVAGAVAFLASDDASYITGEVLVVAGGMVASRL